MQTAADVIVKSARVDSSDADLISSRIQLLILVGRHTSKVRGAAERELALDSGSKGETHSEEGKVV